jgi:hypothetical protein
MNDDTTPEHETARQEKLSRELLLLLSDMTADFRYMPFGPTSDLPDPPPADASPEQLAGWLLREQRRLREAAESDPSVRPGEETTS